MVVFTKECATTHQLLLNLYILVKFVAIQDMGDSTFRTEFYVIV